MMELPIGRGRPGDERGFIHKKLLRGVGALARVGAAVGIPGAGEVSRFARRFGGGGARQTLPRSSTARVSLFSEEEKRQGQRSKFDVGDFGSRLTSGAGPCADPRLIRAPDGHCVAPGSGHARSHDLGGGGGFVDFGEAVLGQYGAGIRPGTRIVDRAVCPRKMQLGNDGVCYNKAQIRNNQRMWPAGRKPLLTGGDMRAISIAARAGKRMDGATARLRKLGMMRKAPAARAPKAPTQHQRLLEAHATK